MREFDKAKFLEWLEDEITRAENLYHEYEDKGWEWQAVYWIATLIALRVVRARVQNADQN